MCIHNIYSSLRAIDVGFKVIDLFPEMTSDSSVPILVDSDSSFAGMGKLMVVSSQRRPFQPSENWMVTIRLNKPPLTASCNIL